MAWGLLGSLQHSGGRRRGKGLATQYDALLIKYTAMDVRDEEALNIAKKELEEKEKEMHEMGDYKTAKNMGEKQTAHLKALDFADKWGENMQLFNACRRGAGRERQEGVACSRGLASPS
eukprot:3942875-Pyramimonas_sp.AAC.2